MRCNRFNGFGMKISRQCEEMGTEKDLDLEDTMTIVGGVLDFEGKKKPRKPKGNEKEENWNYEEKWGDET
jgi:hypothetical protein